MSSPWPKHPNGAPKKVGEMTREEQRTVFKAAADRLQREFQRPEVQAGFALALQSDGKAN